VKDMVSAKAEKSKTYGSVGMSLASQQPLPTAIGVFGYWRDAVNENQFDKIKPDKVKADCELIKCWLINEMMRPGSQQDKEDLVHYLQRMIILVMDDYYCKASNQPGSKTTVNDEPIRHLLSLLLFIQEFFNGYFDNEVKAPLVFQLSWKSELANMLKPLKVKLANVLENDIELADLLLAHLGSLCCPSNKEITYSTISYHNMLVNELLLEKHTTAKAINFILYYLNFNEPEFIMYQFQHFKKMVDLLSAHKEKIALLRLEQKRLNQIPVKANSNYSSQNPPLLMQINSWINEEVKYWEYGFYHNPTGEGGTEYDSKIQTSLSVAKLALIIRLLVVDKIIINRTIAPMLRVVCKIFTTLQKDEISSGSLETKYHNPDKATIQNVRDMLFKWINILGKL
jgi:hypothetical protein